MIISHKLKVIYIRLQKTASTSFEMALSKYCGPDDIISKLGRGYDKTRESLGYSTTTKAVSWWQHTPAKRVKDSISSDIWNNYTKIATIRNPYERMISCYYDRHNHGWIPETQTFEEFIENAKMTKYGIAGFLYGPIHIRRKSIVDFCIRYEHIAEDVTRLETMINCPRLWETMQNFSLNNQFRPNKRTAYKVYSKYPQAKLMIDEDFYRNLSKYELLREHWPQYKSELEKTLATGNKKVIDSVDKQTLLDLVHTKKDLWEKSFEDIQTMLVTIGFSGSGSSLVGYLLTAHPNMVIADEPGNSSDEIARNINHIYKIIEKPFLRGVYMSDLDKILNVIFSLDYVRVLTAQKKDSSKKNKGEAFIARGGRQARYMLVPNQYQGRFKEAKVVGIKHSLHNVKALSKSILRNLKTKLEKRKISLKFILTVRNPYDMISLRVKKTEGTDNKEITTPGIEFITNLAINNKKILDKVDPKDVFISRHEDMVADPRQQLTKLCDFLQVSATSDYLDSCASRVVRELSIRRFEFNWTAEQKQKVASLIEKYDFLSGYDWES